jgi:hypothetical protein
MIYTVNPYALETCLALVLLAAGVMALIAFGDWYYDRRKAKR